MNIGSITMMTLAGAAFLASPLGCHQDDKANAFVPSLSAFTQFVDASAMTVTGVDVQTKLAQLCGIPASKVFFQFDSTTIDADAKDRLDQIATCALSGAAKDKELLLVGRTDPVGTDAYNQQLGMSRADAVARYLKGRGVGIARIEQESKGEIGATTQETNGWPSDRRVTVRLQE